MIVVPYLVALKGPPAAQHSHAQRMIIEQAAVEDQDQQFDGARRCRPSHGEHVQAGLLGADLLAGLTGIKDGDRYFVLQQYGSTPASSD
jgi:hypothetical protein